MSRLQKFKILNNRVVLSRLSRYLINSVSISFDRFVTWVYQGRFYSTMLTHEHIRVDFIRQSCLMDKFKRKFEIIVSNLHFPYNHSGQLLLQFLVNFLQRVKAILYENSKFWFWWQIKLISNVKFFICTIILT